MNTDSCSAWSRPSVSHELSAKNVGLISWIEPMRESTPLMMSQLIAMPTRRSSGPRAEASIEVTSAEVALDGAVDISKLFFGAVLLGGEIDGAVNRKAHHTGLLVNPAVGGGGRVLLFTHLGERLQALRRSVNAVVVEST